MYIIIKHLSLSGSQSISVQDNRTHHRRRVIFSTNTDIKDELARTAISITCYDRNGNVIKQVTSDDEVNVEDIENYPEPSNPNNNGGGISGGNTSSDDDDEGGLEG